MPVSRRKPRGVRASWSGELRFDLVSFRVQAYNVLAQEEGEIHFHQLHDACGSRIQYQKVCPIHGTIPTEEIVLGYEYAANRYVEVEPEELERLRTKSDKALVIDTFIEPEDMDPLYLDGRAYYLTPERAEDREPYAVLTAAMHDTSRCAIGTVVFSEREQLVLLRVVNDALVMMMLRHQPEVRSSGEVLGDLSKSPRDVSQEVVLAEQLIAAETDRDFDFSGYENRYQKRLAKLIDAKIEGKATAMAEAEPSEETPVVNLADALQRSIQRVQGNATAVEHPENPGPSRPRKRHAS